VKIVRRWAWLGWNLLFCGLIIVFSVPLPRYSEDLHIDGPQQEESVQAVDVHIDYPLLLREGDSDRILLQVRLTARPGGKAKAANAILISANLGYSGLDGDPSEVREPIHPGDQGNFSWQIRGQAGPPGGTLWLTLHPSADTQGDNSEVALLAKPIHISTVEWAGMPAGFWRWVGIGGIALGLIWGVWMRVRRKA
jgi:hypothetical protein